MTDKLITLYIYSKIGKYNPTHFTNMASSLINEKASRAHKNNKSIKQINT